MWGEYGNEVDEDPTTTEDEYIKYVDYEDDEDDEEEGVEEDTIMDDISDLMYAIHDINRGLTSLKIQSDYHKSESFSIMMKIIDYHIDSWSEYLYKGKKMRFIKPKVCLRNIGEEEVKKLLYSTECLCEYVSHLCEQLDTCNRVSDEYK